MSKAVVQFNREAVYKQIEKELGKTKADIEKDVKILQGWLKTQIHLPEIPDYQVIQSFLLFNKFSIERAKQKLDMYYTMRGILPDMFVQHPCSPEMIQQARISYVIPLPKLSKDSRRVIYSKISEDYGPEMFNFEKYNCHIFNVFEIMLREDLFLGAHFIYDCKGVKLGHVAKMNPIVLKKASVIMEKVFSNRITSVNLVNYHPMVETGLNLAKSVLPEKIRSRVQTHKSPEGLLNMFSKEILPKDIGGDEDSLADLVESWIEKLKDKKELFDKLGTMRVDESKRPTKLVNDDILGFYGNFKKLEVD